MKGEKGENTVKQFEKIRGGVRDKHVLIDVKGKGKQNESSIPASKEGVEAKRIKTN